MGKWVFMGKIHRDICRKGIEWEDAQKITKKLEDENVKICIMGNMHGQISICWKDIQKGRVGKDLYSWERCIVKFLHCFVLVFLFCSCVVVFWCCYCILVLFCFCAVMLFFSCVLCFFLCFCVVVLFCCCVFVLLCCCVVVLLCGLLQNIQYFCVTPQQCVNFPIFEFKLASVGSAVKA